MLLRVLLAVLALVSSSTRIERVQSHEESGEWSCDSNSDIRVQAEFRPGIITLDGQVEDWKYIAGSDFSLFPALEPDVDKEYNAGKMTAKAVHDGKDVFFMLQVDGKYAYVRGENHKCPSVALMFQIGENASYHEMGGCTKAPDACSNKTCHGHEVDIMHFSIGNAIPGRLYGGNPIDNGEGNGGDRFGHLVDVYAWNPHCRYLDGLGPSVCNFINDLKITSHQTLLRLDRATKVEGHSLVILNDVMQLEKGIFDDNVSSQERNDTSAQNDWKGAWWHSSLSGHAGFLEEDSPYSTDGQKGTYYFEFSRPLRTMDRLQQDVQFTIGKSSKASVAFWYPMDEKPWHGSGHYSISCDWVPLDIIAGTSEVTQVGERSPWDAATAFSLFFSVVAFCMSIFVGHRVSRTKTTVPFTPMENL